MVNISSYDGAYMSPKTILATLIRKRRLGPRALMVTFAVPKGKPFHFRAGQHVILKIPAGTQVLDRPFSIASSPLRSDHIEILATLVPGGVASTFLEQARPGTAVTLIGPKGHFRVRSHRRPIRFIASGAGIAPFRAMIAELVSSNPCPPMELDFIVPGQGEALILRELRALARHPKFRFILVTNPASYFQHLAVNPGEDIYLCGGWHFVEDATRLLLRRGVKKSQIHFEKFT